MAERLLETYREWCREDGIRAIHQLGTLDRFPTQKGVAVLGP